MGQIAPLVCGSMMPTAQLGTPNSPMADSNDLGHFAWSCCWTSQDFETGAGSAGAFQPMWADKLMVFSLLDTRFSRGVPYVGMLNHSAARFLLRANCVQNCDRDICCLLCLAPLREDAQNTHWPESVDHTMCRSFL